MLKAHRLASVLSSCALLVACAHDRRQASSNHGTDNISKRVAWSEPSLAGNTFSSASLQGAPVYLNFFASWCHGCNEEASAIESTSRHFASRGLRVVGVDIGENAELAAEFRDWNHLTYPIVIDNGNMRDLYHVSALPVQVFIDRQGNIRVVRGQISAQQMQSNVQRML